MKVGEQHYRTIWMAEDGRSVEIIDQTLLPHRFATLRLRTLADAARAIRTMQVRGAPLIGATAAYGICLALLEDSSDAALEGACAALAATRPTAVNLGWALDEMRSALAGTRRNDRVGAAFAAAAAICEDDVATCRAIGEHGLGLIETAWARRGRTGTVNVSGRRSWP